MCNSCKVTPGITWTNLNIYIYIYSKSYKKKIQYQTTSKNEERE